MRLSLFWRWYRSTLEVLGAILMNQSLLSLSTSIEAEFRGNLHMWLTRFTVGGTQGVSSKSSPKPSSTTSITVDIIGLLTAFVADQQNERSMLRLNILL